MTSRPHYWPLTVILVVYVVLAVAYSLASPLYEPTDEIRHFRYVRHLVVYRELPVQSAEGPRAQSHHPPLYYVLGALASWWVPVEQDVYSVPSVNPHWDNDYWEVGGDNKNQFLHRDDERFPFRGVTLAVYVVRWMTVLIGAGVIWVTGRVGYELFSDRPWLATSAAALVAFTPQFVYLSGAINNDIAAALCGAAVLWACVRLVREGPRMRTDVTLGVLYGLALVTKFNLLALLGLIELAYVLAVWPERDWRAFVRGNLIVLGLAAVISGGWFVRNQALYGDPTGMSKVNELWEGRPASEGLWAIRQSLPYLWSSLWGRFGYGQVPLPQMIYRVLFSFCTVALAGCLIPHRRAFSKPVLVLLVVTPIVFSAVVFYYIAIQPAGAMGRFLFPALPAFALLMAFGLGNVVPRRLTWVAGLGVTMGMVALAIYGLMGVLVPAFARPRQLSQAELAAVPNSTDVDLGGVARLLGYTVEPLAVAPGDTVEVTVYWETQGRTERDCAVFVHLLSDVGTMIAQRDTYPGLGRYPTTTWGSGIAFADTYRVRVPETAYAPDKGYVQIGMYRPDGPRLTAPDGRDALRLAEIEIMAPGGPFPNPLHANFGKAALVGYALDRRVVHPGETVGLTLYWQALAPFERNYSVFAHVLGVDDQVWAHNDGWPVEGQAPTRTWQAGQIIEDVRPLTVGLTTPPGFYDIEVGLHASEEGRLPVVAEDGHWLANRVLLSKIRVLGESTD